MGILTLTSFQLPRSLKKSIPRYPALPVICNLHSQSIPRSSPPSRGPRRCRGSLKTNSNGFIHGPRMVSSHLREKTKEKSEVKEKMKPEVDNMRLLIVVEGSERLKEILPHILVPQVAEL
ncbi:hypothetical protein C0995_008263, partial [Termitomyces sp. Mi166